jgi:hypothetical protein
MYRSIRVCNLLRISFRESPIQSLDVVNFSIVAGASQVRLDVWVKKAICSYPKKLIPVRLIVMSTMFLDY